MPKSAIRPKVKQKSHDRIIREEIRARARSEATLRKRLGWPLFILGALLFLVGNIASRAGLVVLPIDTHHLISQFGGAALAVVGVMWATGGATKR